MDTAALVNRLIDLQSQRGFSDVEFARLLGLNTRQGWYQLSKGKKGLSVSVLARAYQEFPEIGPDLLLWLRNYKNGG